MIDAFQRGVWMEVLSAETETGIEFGMNRATIECIV